MGFKDVFGKKRLYFDGGMGSLLIAKGLKPGELPELWNINRSEDIVEVHESYLRAGADEITTNTFGANMWKYPDNLEAVIRGAIDNAKAARDRVGKEAFIGFDMGPTGKLLAPLGDLPFEEAVSMYARNVEIANGCGADFILIETINDVYEAKAAVLAAKENSDLPIVVTCVFDENHKMLTGADPDTMVAIMEGLGVTGLGINCSLGPVQMVPIIKRIMEISSIPVIINPNAGLPRSENGQTVYDITREEFANVMADIAKIGVSAMGGCCGTNPDYIRTLVERTRDIPLAPITKKNRSVISSFGKCVEFGNRPIIIGERINPTGKKKFKEALINRDDDYILRQGLQQEEAGADVLDVNVGLPEIDEAGVLSEIIEKLQGITVLPLQIDTADGEAMERALRMYNGKALINSVNGKQEIMDMVFPLAAKYGGMIVALALDESGIPETWEGRIEIAKKIISEAAKYGIEKKDIIIDGLALTISSDSRAALTTLKTVEAARHDLGVHTILGVSNISFGLPRREIINSTFFAMAMTRGLSAGIINPNSEDMMKAFHSYLALSDMDENFDGYIGTYSGTQEKPVPVADGEMLLNDAIIKGMKSEAAKAAEKELLKSTPMDILNEHLIPALDTVGIQFEKGTLFLPQLLMAAEAAQGAFSVVKAKMAAQAGALKAKVILATVKGDIHDIGKNIVKVLLENYGYQVIDLGKDVAPETILERALKDDVDLVGLSALMTTTVPSMEKTISLLKEKRPQTKIIVGGAVLTQEYADMIHADFYAKDAMATVRICDGLCE